MSTSAPTTKVRETTFNHHHPFETFWTKTVWSVGGTDDLSRARHLIPSQNHHGAQPVPSRSLCGWRCCDSERLLRGFRGGVGQRQHHPGGEACQNRVGGFVGTPCPSGVG